MIKLFNAFMYKLTKDITFKVMLIIGTVLAVATAIIFLILDATIGQEMSGPGEAFKYCSGQSMLMFSLSPAQNFGIAIPINLVTFIVLEFSQGTIRNKVIVGNSKFKIYSSIFLCGLVFAISLVAVYVGVCCGLGSIFGGFNVEGMAFTASGTGYVSADFIVRVVSLTLFSYFGIVSFTTFFATLFRNVGPCIPVIIIAIMGLSMLGMLSMSFLAAPGDNTSDIPLIEAVVNFSKTFNPLHAASGYEVEIREVLIYVPELGENVTSYSSYFVLKNDTLIYSIVNNTIYTILFFVLGAAIFYKRDIK